jgi:hypothetical protein
VALPASVATSAANSGAVLTFASTAGLAIGQVVTGTSIPAGTFISALTPTTVTLSVTPTASIGSTASIAFAGEFETAATTGGGTSGTNFVTLASTTGLVAGETVEGTNIASGTIIASINSTTGTVFFNQNVGGTVATSTPLYFGNIAGTPSLGAGAGENFTGTVTVAGGTLQIQPTANSGNGSAPLFATPGSTTTNNIVFTTDAQTGTGYAGGTFQLLGTPSGITGALTTTVGSLTLTAGAGTIMTTAVGGGGTPTLDFVNTAPLTRSAGAVVDFAPGLGTTIEFNSSPTLTNGILGGYAYFTNSSGGVDFATITGSGPFTVAAFTGYTPLVATAGSPLVNYINDATVAGSISSRRSRSVALSSLRPPRPRRLAAFYSTTALARPRSRAATSPLPPRIRKSSSPPPAPTRSTPSPSTQPSAPPVRRRLRRPGPGSWSSAARTVSPAT